MGIRIPTVVKDNVARRCDGCLEVIDGTPWRINLLDIVTTEVAAPWNDTPAINPGPFQFHSDESHVRPLDGRSRLPLLSEGPDPRDHAADPVPSADGASVRWGLCDGIHRDDHELIPA